MTHQALHPAHAASSALAGTSTQVPSAAATRIGYIDGLRGWAALSVMMFHLLWEVFGQLLPHFRSNHLRFLLGGHLDVCIFFVLSGDALATPFVATGRMSIVVTTAVRRYSRLAIPILMTSAIVYLLMVFGLALNRQAAAAGFRPDWLGVFLDFAPSFTNMLAYASFGVFAPAPSTNEYNPFLWTMPIEMLGSILVFLFLLVMPSFRKPLVVCVVVGAFLLLQGSYLGLFFVGIARAILRHRGHLDAIASRRLAQPAIVLLFLAAYLIYCYVLSAKDRSLDLIAAVVFVSLVYVSLPARRFFEMPISKFLGRISFPLYLVHFLVMVSLTSAGAIYLQATGRVSYVGALAVGGASALLSIALAWQFSRVEGWLQSHVNAALDRWVLSSRGQ